jgi:hypothetical protein
VPARYVYGALIVYVLMAGVVAVMDPSGNEIEIVTDALLWPFSVLDWLWSHLSSFYGRMFG